MNLSDILEVIVSMNVERLRETLIANPIYPFAFMGVMALVSLIKNLLIRKSPFRWLLSALSSFFVLFLFLAMMWVMMGSKDPMAFAFFALIGFGIMLFNVLGTRFCPGCRRTLSRQPILARARFCSYCGDELE